MIIQLHDMKLYCNEFQIAVFGHGNTHRLAGIFNDLFGHDSTPVSRLFAGWSRKFRFREFKVSELHPLDTATAHDSAAKRITPANKVPGNHAVDIHHITPSFDWFDRYTNNRTMIAGDDDMVA